MRRGAGRGTLFFQRETSVRLTLTGPGQLVAAGVQGTPNPAAEAQDVRRVPISLPPDRILVGEVRQEECLDLLMVPLVYVLLTVFQVQRAA